MRICVVVLALFAASQATAQTWPDKPIRLLVGFAAGARADVRERFDVLGMAPIGNTPAEFAAVIAAETPQWARVIRDAGIKAGE